MAPQAEEPTLIEGTPATVPAVVKEQQPEEKTHAESEDGSNEEMPENEATTEDQVTTTGNGFDFSTMCCGGLPSVFTRDEEAKPDDEAEAEKAAKATKIQAVVRGKQARASTDQLKADREAAKTTETTPVETKPTFMQKLKTLFSGCGKKADTAVVVEEPPKEDAPEAKKEEEEKPKEEEPKEEKSSEEKPTEQPQDV